MGKTDQNAEGGFTLIELVVATAVLAVIAVGVLSLYASLVFSANLSKRKAVALTLATNQMEYIKSLPYDSLAIAGGAIYSPTPLPSTTTKTLNGLTYTIKTSINYVDEAYDGCASYPTTALKLKYCRNYPPPTGAPVTDTNPQDYKVVHVSVTTVKNSELAAVDTQISARVAETASTTGALFINVIDATGNPISGATVNVTDATLVPAVNVSDTTDSNGTAVFYGLPPDTSGTDYNIVASKSGYSTLSTIAASGSLQPNYPKKQIFTQQSSLVTMVIMPQGQYSLWAEAVTTTGTAIPSLKLYAKGGYKNYNSTTDTSYYYDNTTLVTDSTGNLTINNLVPGTYIFCGDLGATGCSTSSPTTTYYLVAAVPYGGNNSLSPIVVPIYDPASPPTTTFTTGGNAYLQKVRLIFSTVSNHPRVFTVTPDDVSIGAGGLTAFAFTLTGANLPCGAVAASCGTVVKLTQGADVRTASCTGPTSGALVGLVVNCIANLTGIAVGMATLSVTSNAKTLSIPGSPLLGGINVAL